MKAHWIALAHTVLALALTFLPGLIASHQGIANLTVGGALALVINTLLAYTIPVTNGASSHQQ